MATARSDSQIPVVFASEDFAHEAPMLVALHRGVDFEIVGVECAAQDLAVQHRSHRGQPFERDRRIDLAADVPLRWRTGIEAVLDPMLHGGQDHGRHEVRIGVGTRRAMLDAARRARSGRDAEGDRAVVRSPALVDRHEHVGGIAPERVHVRREERHGFGERRLHAGDRMAEQRRAERAAVVEPVAALRIDQAQMDVHAAAAAVEKRFRHEARRHAMASRDRLDRATQQQRMIGRGHRIAHMVEVDLVLRGRELGRGDGHGDTLQPTGALGLSDETAEKIEFLDAVGLHRREAPVGAGNERRLRPAGRIGIRIEQIESSSNAITGCKPVTRKRSMTRARTWRGSTTCGGRVPGTWVISTWARGSPPRVPARACPEPA